MLRIRSVIRGAREAVLTEGIPGSDVLATWYNPFMLYNVSGIDLPFWKVLIAQEEGQVDVGVARAYRSYLVSHALTGSPNTGGDVLNAPPAIEWPLTEGETGQFLTNVLNVTGSGFELVTDEEDFESVTQFWIGIFEEITKLGGYSP